MAFEMGGECSTYGRGIIYIYIYRGLVGKPEEKRLLGRPRRRWEIILRGIFRQCYGMDWIELAQVGTDGRHVLIAIMNFRVP
jgi:hypothetical protein